jgi:hypothetical protein
MQTHAWGPHSPTGKPVTVAVLTVTLAILVLLTLTTTVLGRSAQDDEGYERINRQGLTGIDQINEALHRWSRTFFIVAGALFIIVAVKIIRPFQIYHSVNDRRLAKAVRRVDDLLKRIQAEAETTASDSKEGPAEAGLLTAMAEIAEFSQAEQVPAYVLTVNDLMLDNIRITLHRLQRFEGGNADRYRNYMFSVMEGMKTITEESLRSGTPSGLAVDLKEYFRDDQRYRAWEKLLHHVSRKGGHGELAETFLLFMKNIREGRALILQAVTPPPALQAVVASTPRAPRIPQVLDEETLPILQQAAVREAGSLVSLIRAGRFVETHDPVSGPWQFEFVHRQQQLHLREEAQKMLTVFLDCERKELPRITGMRMLPCRTWQHTLRMLGVAEGPALTKRVEDGWLTIQEIIILQKAFLQTFAKKESIEHVYGHGKDTELMMNLHIPQIRREALGLLRRLAASESVLFDRAAKALNEEETPQHNEVVKLVEHYVRHHHDPPGILAEQ